MPEYKPVISNQAILILLAAIGIPMLLLYIFGIITRDSPDVEPPADKPSITQEVQEKTTD